MKTFKKGDRVVYNPRSATSASTPEAIGKQATIVFAESEASFLIEFDEDVSGHKGNNEGVTIKEGCGWYVGNYDLKHTRGRKPKKDSKPQVLAKFADSIEDTSMRSLLASYAVFVRSAVKFKEANDDSTLNKLIDFTLIERQMINLGEDLKAAFITIKESEDGNQ